MTSDVLHQTLAQNRENLKTLLDELDADYELPHDPEKQATIAAHFGGSPERVKEAQMTKEERVAWLFEENAKALSAAVDAAGARNAASPTVAESGALDAVTDALGGGQ